jgi:transcriptional regulator with XRE-family HTH domain
VAKKFLKLSEQVRRAIDASGVSRYRICKTTGLSEPTMSRFMTGKGGLSMEMLDKIGEYLGLTISAEGASAASPKPKRETKPRT